MTKSMMMMTAVERERHPLTAGYEVVAAEYYDAMRHPTCANFRHASGCIISRCLTRTDQQIVEVGCGRSIVAEIMTRLRSSLRALTLVDSSPTMLAYSSPFEADGAKLVLSTADDLELLDDSADLVIASLGDPFNTEAFWLHVRRILRPSGQVVFTTPSFEWSSQFRHSMSHPPDAAEFITADGTQVFLPSFVMPEEQQIRALELVGLEVRAVERVTMAGLGAAHVSPKLRHVPDGKPIVTGYLCSAQAVKPQVG